MAQVTQVTNYEKEISLTCKKLNEVIVLNHEEIIKLLPLFKEECVYMREAYFEDGVLQCTFDTFEYPFSKIPMRHLTRTHVLLFVTQASYLMASVMKRYEPNWPLTHTQSVDFALREQMTFTNIQITFRHFIKNTHGIKLNLKFPKFRVIRSRLYVFVEFDFPKGCFGTCKGIVALDGSMKPG